MRVGLVASPWVPVPPPRYGGTEVMLDVLARGLQAAGDEVRLVTTGDSTCPVPRSWVYDTALGTEHVTVTAEARHVVRAYDELRDCDLIHDHTVFGPLYAATRTDIPIVATNHGPFTPELHDIFAAMGDDVAIVAISHHQRATAPDIPVRAVIHHGIDVERIPVGDGHGGYALFLGRMARDKGTDRAIRAARDAGLPIVIAAKMREPAELAYFRDEVVPLLGSDAEYVGEVGGAEKYELLAGAVALLNPIRWPEPFGIVMVEALAAGTPVVSFDEGAAAEIVDDGVTGFLCDDEQDLVKALLRVHDLDRRRCRAAAESRFSAARMVADHRRLYRNVLTDTPSAGSSSVCGRTQWTPR